MASLSGVAWGHEEEGRGGDPLGGFWLRYKRQNRLGRGADVSPRGYKVKVSESMVPLGSRRWSTAGGLLGQGQGETLGQWSKAALWWPCSSPDREPGPWAGGRLCEACEGVQAGRIV